jgi:pimeloyl-ACP methyl ester carboxylesterase
MKLLRQINFCFFIPENELCFVIFKQLRFRTHPVSTFLLQSILWFGIMPDAQIVELDNAGHWAHEEVPGKVIESLRSFMKEQ